MRFNIDPNDSRPIKEVLLINTCCSAGFKLVTEYQKAHPEIQVKPKTIGLFNARDQKLHEKYGFTLEELGGSGHGILIVDEKIYAKC